MINSVGGEAMGLCGMDGGMMRAVQLTEDNRDYGLVGKIVAVNPRIINDALDKGYIPVVSSVAQGIDGNDAYNINADTVAAKLAVALGAIKLILLTDVRGVMLDAGNEDTMISKIRIAEIPKLIEDGVIQEIGRASCRVRV